VDNDVVLIEIEGNTGNPYVVSEKFIKDISDYE
jgi:hypothetical protein